MHSALRLSSRVPVRRAQAAPSRLLPTLLSRSYAQSYGGDESGHKGTDAANRSESAEHPGPPPPSGASSDGGKKSGGEKNPEQQQQVTTESGSEKAGGAKPKLHRPGPPDEEQSDEVKEHNKDFEKRPDRASNRITDEGKVEKEFWSGGQ